MAGLKSILIVAALFSGAVWLNGNKLLMQNAPLQIARIAMQIADCAGDRIYYRDLEIDCDSPVSFADLRKLDLRAENLLRPGVNQVATVVVGN